MPAAERLLDPAIRRRGECHGRRDLERDEDRAAPRHVDLGARERHHRPVPEVDAVAALPDPAQRGGARHARDPARGVGEGADERGRRDREREQPAAVHDRVVVMPRRHRDDHRRETGDRAGVEQQPRARLRRRPQLAERPQEREQDADQQPRRVRVGPEVDPRRVLTGREQHRHQDRRGDRPGEREPRGAAASEPPQAGHQQQRPEQVELLLDRERPQVLEQRRPLEAGEVRAVGQDLRPIPDVCERREGVGAYPRRLVRHEGDRHHQADGDHEERRRQQAARPPHPEPAQIDAAGRVELAQEQRRDQEPAEDQEQVDAEEAAGKPRHAAVVQQHAGHGERAQAVERRHVRQRGRSGIAKGLHGGDRSMQVRRRGRSFWERACDLQRETPTGAGCIMS